MAATTLAGRLLNDGTLGPTTKMGDRLDEVHDYLTGIVTCLTVFQQQQRTRTYSSAALAEGTNANTFKTTATVNYSIDGVLYSKAATDNLAFTAASQQADLTDCAYLVELDSSGTAATVKGTAVASGGTIVVPAPSAATKCPIGYIKVALSGSTFTAGSTDLSAAGVTATYFNLAVLPATTTGSTALALTTLSALQPTAV